MSDYFSDVRQGLGDAVERRAHIRWYSRLRERLNPRTSRTRSLTVVLAALLIATPAVGAVTNWFTFGKPDATGPIARGGLFGVVKPGGSRLLPIRIADPQGGPPWGLRLVRTNKGNVCVQLGRVEAGRLGSLGIDYSWNNDHRFHAISPNADYVDDCGNTDASGYGYGNWDLRGVSAAANPTYDGTRGPQGAGCKLRGFGGPHSWPICPAGTNRIVVYGLLGPDATSVTYRKLGGGLATQRTVGGVGAYLLVFPYNRKTCDTYEQGLPYCSGKRASGLTPNSLVITAVHYRDGRSCGVIPPARLSRAYDAFNRRIDALPRLRSQRLRYARYDHFWNAFLHEQHLTAGQFAVEMRPTCPAVGWVSYAARHITVADVTTLVSLRTFPVGTYTCPKNSLHLPDGCNYGAMRNGVVHATRVVPVEWSFKARLAVTSDRSWYGWELDYPRGCGAGGQSGSTDTRIRAGQTLRYSTFVSPNCRGTYHLTVGFMPQAPAGMLKPGGTVIGRDGSLVVGRATFTIH
jgi:hypothetical protein